MPASDAQIAANRRNSALSTGPKTVDGKEKSRRNSLKHGLTAEALVLTNEEVAEVNNRYKMIQAELLPSGFSSAYLLHRFAYMTVRLDRCERLDTAVYQRRIRHAEQDFDDHRQTRVDEIASQLGSNPMTASRRLQYLPEGINYLIKEWKILRADLLNTERRAWTTNHRFHMDEMLGSIPGGYRLTRHQALTETLGGFSSNINPSEISGLNEQEQVEWARNELRQVIDDEIARLQVAKENLDPSIIEQDRLEAKDRSLFDIQPAMNQVRKYEAATERSMYKALNEFRRLETELKSHGIDVEEDRPAEELASFEPQAGEPEELGEPKRHTPRQAPKEPAQIPESIRIHPKRTLDTVESYFGSDQLSLC